MTLSSSITMSMCKVFVHREGVNPNSMDGVPDLRDYRSFNEHVLRCNRGSRGPGCVIQVGVSHHSVGDVEHNVLIVIGLNLVYLLMRVLRSFL